METVNVTGILHVFRFADRLLLELVTPRGDSVVEGLATSHGHVVTIEVTADHGEPKSLADFSASPTP